jgi:hypothetical protein
MDQGFEREKAQWYTYLAALAEGKLAAEEGPWLVAHDVPEEVFLEWEQDLESRWKVAWIPYSTDENTGQVVFFGDPSVVHEEASAWLMQEVVIAHLLSIGGRNLMNSIRYTISSTALHASLSTVSAR